jgi:hypothetical protein
MNHMLRTALLMTVMTVLVVVIGGSIAGQGGATLGVIIAIVMNLLSYWNSDTLVLGDISHLFKLPCHFAAVLDEDKSSRDFK